MIRQVHMSLSTRLLLVSGFLMNVGQFMSLPFLVLYLTNTLRYPVWQVGTLLSANVLCARAFPLVAGMIGDRIGHNKTILTGIAIRGAGFIGLALFQSFVPLLIATALIGIGGALYSPSIHAVFASQPEEQRRPIFATFNQALNLGAVVGPLLGTVLITQGILLPFFSGGSLFLCLAVVLFFFRRQYNTVQSEVKIQDSFKQILGHRQFIAFTLIMMLFYILFSQLTVSFPLEAFRRSHSNTSVSMVFIVNGIAGVLLMTVVLKKVFLRYNPLLLVQLGLLFTGLGFALVPFFPSGVGLSGCVALYTLGETLVLPGSDMVIAEISATSSENTGAFFGMFSFAWAIGGTLGNYLGTWLMSSAGTFWPWLLYGGIGLSGFLLLMPMARQRKLRSKNRI